MNEEPDWNFRQIVQPRNLVHEASLLACLLTEPELMQDISADLDFCSDDNQKLFRWMRKTPDFDAVTAMDAFSESGLWIMDLMNELPTTARFSYFLQSVIDLGEKRKIIKLCWNVILQSQEESTNPNDLKHELGKLEVVDTQADKQFDVHIKQLIKPTLENIKARQDGDLKVLGSSTGFNNINRIFTLKPSELIVLAARPSLGKTTLLLNIMFNRSYFGDAVGIISIEMTKEQLAEKIMISQSNFDEKDVKPEAMQSLLEVAEDLKNRNIHICDKPGIKMGEIVAKARKWKKKHGIKVLGIDYLQLIKPNRGEKYHNRENEISQMIAGLKGLGKELGITMIVLAQLNRQADEVRPKLSNLRESGSIEQDADIVCFLHGDKTESVVCSTELIVSKNRNGATGVAYLTFFKKFSRLEDGEKPEKKQITQSDWYGE